MHLSSYRVQNYRRLRDVSVQLADDISIFVGANNSGKTSATQALQTFLSGSKEQFTLYDFSSSNWKLMNEMGDQDLKHDGEKAFPSITLDLWFTVSETDLYLVLPILPSSAWEGTQVGVRIVLAPRNDLELLQRFREARANAKAQAAKLTEAGTYTPWPRTMAEYLEKELTREFELRYYVLDRAKFDEVGNAEEGYTPVALSAELGGPATLSSLIRVDCLHAQRHLADPRTGTQGGGGRAEDLSRRLSRFYQRNLQQRPDDHQALKALFDSETSLNVHLMEVFKPTLDRLAKLGYPGLHNPKLEITSGLNPATVMSQDARVNYVLGDATPLRLPDSYNGLGLKNLIYMVVEILDVQERWRLEEHRPPLHLIFIEEPEAHLHAQLQQVFIRNVLELMKIEGDKGGVFSSQVVVTTHSPHILYERGFGPIRYFRRHVADGEQTTQVVNLSTFKGDAEGKDREFLQRYLKLTHCDLFFADAAILVEGNVERLLMPLMIEKDAKNLRSVALSLLEVGGAFAHRFRDLIHFLGITTLVVTDLDSVELVEKPNDDAEDPMEKEFEVPEEGKKTKVKKFGTACVPAPGTVTANQTLIQWLPKLQTIDELLAAKTETKIESIEGTDHAKVRVAYQTPTVVQWKGKDVSLCGRTLEISFALQNLAWCQDPQQQSLGLQLRGKIAEAAEFAERLHKRVSGTYFDKSKFALGVLARAPEGWQVPHYIAEGLKWLAQEIDHEAALEVQAAAQAAAETVPDAAAGGG